MNSIYEEIVQKANEFIVIVQGGVIRFLNNKARRLNCFNEEDILGRSFLPYIHAEDRPMVLDLLDRRLKGEDVPNVSTFRIIDDKGGVYWVENNAVLIEWENSPATLNFLTDITEQKRIEGEFRASEERNRLYLENASDIIFVMDHEFRILNISPRVFDVIGYSAEEIVNKDITTLDILKPGYVDKAYDETARVLSGSCITSSMYEITGRDGRNLFVEISAAPLILDGRLTNIICVARNMTERKMMEDTLRLSEKRYREILDEIEDGYYEVDLAGNFTFFNQSMCSILGYAPDAMMGMNYRAFMDEPTASKVFRTFSQVFTTGEPAKAADLELVRKGGTQCFVEASITLMRDESGAPSGFRGIARDVTDQKNLEQQLYQIQKMEAIGTLAGGIAHDFNNILSGILGYAELALMDVDPHDQVTGKLEQITRACERARSLVSQILTFSRRNGTEKKPVMVMPLVNEALKMLRASLPANIEIFSALNADDVIIEADPTNIHQIVINLCTNAYHAVKDTGGIIEIRLDPVELDSTHAVFSLDLKPGRYVELAVVDTGCGMNPEVVDRIFEPYYTTKSKGEGTGLGLAIVHGIVRGLGGGIRVQSILGKGSSFHVYLPVISDPVRHVPEQVRSVPTGSEAVLVVDDEQSITDITRSMLERLGYRVTVYQSSIEALDDFRKNCEEYDLVISDLTMPRMNGDQLAEHILSIRPDMPIILCSGYRDIAMKEKASKRGIHDVLIKPVTLSDLAVAVRRALDSGTTTRQ